METALELLEEKVFALRTGEEKNDTKEAPEKWVSWLPLASSWLPGFSRFGRP